MRPFRKYRCCNLSLLKISTGLREAGDFREPAVRFSLPLYRSSFCVFAAAPRLNSDLSLFSISWPFCTDNAPVRTENSDSGVLVMKPPDQGMRHDATDPLNRARDRRIFVQ